MALVNVLWPFAAAAQIACAPHENVVNELAQRFKEAPEANGITPDGMLLEVFSETRS